MVVPPSLMESARNRFAADTARLRSPIPGGGRPRTRGRPAGPVPLVRTVVFGPLAHPFLLAPEVGDELSDVLAGLLVGRAGADDLGGPPDVGQGLLPGAELVGRDARGLVAEPVGLPEQGGHVGDRLLGAGPALALGEERKATPAEMARPSAEPSTAVRRPALRSAAAVARASAAATSAARARSPTDARNAATSRASTPALRGRTAREGSRHRLASRTSSPSAPQESSRAKAPSRRPAAASSRTSGRLPI